MESSRSPIIGLLSYKLFPFLVLHTLTLLAMDDLQALFHSIVANLQDLNPLILTGMATLLLWLVLSYHNSGAWKVRYIDSATLYVSDPLLAKTIPNSWF